MVARLLGGGVDVDEDKQQQIEEDADEAQHSQEPLLWCAEVGTRELHVKHLVTLNKGNHHDAFVMKYI